MKLPSLGNTNIHDLSQPGRIFKIFDDISAELLGQISRQISGTCLSEMQAQESLTNALDKKLQHKIWIAWDEGCKIYMVTGVNSYYEIELEEKLLPHDTPWTFSDPDLQEVFSDMDESDLKQGGWLNPSVRGKQPLTLIPHLGKSVDNEIFSNYNQFVRSDGVIELRSAESCLC